ncbi:marvel domain-containing protein [Alternaria rosae]|uniref:marvel domain-containing protein n=1 Tax=Alternaria rosae TaxID=1187941 RepID=UPI001E8D4248|nr:marvel domain-containing protein [Alternaria rosae]KAH6878129.1 marvel domain-containing protein [Alternaria rosae]
MVIANPLLNFVVRGFQALFGIVVLGISVSLIRGHHWGGLPASLGFSAFVGGVTILGAAIGVAGLFFSFLDGMIGLIVDGAVAVINAAGGIVLALKISGVDCDADTTIENATKLVLNDIFNGGCIAKDNCWYYYEKNDPNTMKSRCKSTQADCVFMFLTVIVLAVTALLAFLRMKKGY